MNLVPSLSIVLPVHNAETTLADTVCRLLEMLPDLAERFELLVVDDGSTDHTAEVALELAQQFPQLRLERHGQRRGMSVAVQTGMNHTSGEFILVQDEREPLSPRDIARLWGMRHDEDLVVARTQSQLLPVESSLITKLMNWGRAVQQLAAERPLATGTQLIRRRAVQELAEDKHGSNGLRLARVHGAEKIARVLPRRSSAGVVSQLKDFALGE